jgi:hypothetical protein
MATLVQTAYKMFLGGLDISCFSQTFTLELTADSVECTTYCSGGAREYKQGLKSWTSSWDGYADFAAAADTASPLVPGEVITPANMGTQNNGTWAPTGTEGEACYLSDGILAGVTPLSGTVGEMALFHGDLMPADRTVGQRMVRGRVEANRTVSTSTNTTGSQLGALSATQTLYASLHVFTLSGTSPTLDVIVQSDNGSGFPSPTDQITFTQATTRSGQYGSKAGAVTDDWWRVKWTLGGSGSPTARFAVSIGII